MKRLKYLFLVFTLLVLITSTFSAGYQVKASDINKNTQITTPAGLMVEDRYAVIEGAEVPTDSAELGGIITSVTDTQLSNMLLLIYKSFNINYTENYLRINMFRNFSMLNLSNLIQGTDTEVSLDGLKNLNFKNLKILNLSNNNIASFNSTLFPKLLSSAYDTSTSLVKGLETLDLSNNKLTGVLDLAGETTQEDGNNIVKIYFPNLTTIYASSNNLTGITLNKNQTSDMVLDLRNNNIINFENIVVPITAHLDIILFGNPITTISSIPTNIHLEIGLINFSNSTTSADSIRFIDFTLLELDTKIYMKTEMDDNEVFVNYEYNPTNLTDFSFSLTAGVYKVEYIENDIVLSSREYTVRPPVADYKFVIKGVEYSTYTEKITGKGEIRFTTPDENITVFYNYGDGNWIQGNTADLTKKNGTYALRFKTVENGIDSVEYGILVKVSYNKFVPDIVLVIFIILLIVSLALVLIPLFSKFLNKISKPR